MDKEFREWIECNIRREYIRSILYESIVCYKNNAYRASLLLSYNAFLDIVRDRIKEASKPNAVKDGDWIHNQKLLLDEDESDKIVLGLLFRSDNKYFKLSDSIRTQLRYWKDRRNDCAHLKSNRIESSHTESFWLFMMSNLNKIIVVDSKEELENRIKVHFNQNYTRFGEDYTNLIKDIPSFIELDEFYTFLEKLPDIFDDIELEEVIYMEEIYSFIYKMIESLEGEYYSILKKFIENNEQISVGILRNHPNYLIHYKEHNPKYIRNMWKTHLKHTYNKVDFTCEVLKNNIIPTEELEEFIKESVYFNNDSIPKNNQLDFLKKYKYLDEINLKLSTFLDPKIFEDSWFEKNLKFLEYYFIYNIKNNEKGFEKIIDLMEDNISEDYYFAEMNRLLAKALNMIQK